MSLENPLSILFNTEGVELAVSQSQVLTGSGVTPGILMFGSSSTGIATPWRAATDGAMFVTGTVNASFTPTANTPVSQGNPSNPTDSWFVSITDGTQVIGDSTASPIFVSGAVTVDGTVNVGNFPVTQSVKIDQSITLPVSVSNFPDVQTVTGSVSITGNSTTTPLWVTGSVTTNFDPSTSATVTAVSSSTTVVTLAAANGNRRGLTIYNDSSKILFVKLGSAASQTDFSVKLSSQGYYEVVANYTGIVTGLWSAVNGFGYVTEILD